MGKVTIQKFTTKNPISMIGEEAGVCWGADTSDAEKNYKRGIGCLTSGHGRTWEFPDVYLILDGYSARVIREWYTHIGGAPTRLQSSTRYIDYEHGFDYILPDTVKNIVTEDGTAAETIYREAMAGIMEALRRLDEAGVPREDSAMLLPLGMATKIVCKHNFRNLADMSRQRMCSRAYREYREMFSDVAAALSAYSAEWQWLVGHYFMAKCEVTGFCEEKKSCGRRPHRPE